MTSKKYILVDGTSSAGKTTICEYYSKKKFGCYQIDNYWNTVNYENEMKKIKNNYGALNMKKKVEKNMMDDIIASKKNALIDHVEQDGVKDYMKKIKLFNKLFIIVVFTNLEGLARNIESRRKEGDPRGVFVFKQFSKRYIKTNDKDKERIETVNRADFKKLLQKYFKYAFENKDELLAFADNVFKNMNINDDKDHYVKLRDNFEYDYLLITTNKTKKEIFDELDEIVLK